MHQCLQYEVAIPSLTLMVCDHLWENRPSPCINWNPLFACTWKLHPCTIQKHQALDNRLLGLLLQTAFYRCCETTRVHFMVLRGINGTAWGTRLLLTPVLVSLVDCISLCHTLKAQHCSSSLNGCFNPPSVSHLPLPPPTCPPIPIDSTHDITGTEKNLKNQQHSSSL